MARASIIQGPRHKISAFDIPKKLQETLFEVRCTMEASKGSRFTETGFMNFLIATHPLVLSRTELTKEQKTQLDILQGEMETYLNDCMQDNEVILAYLKETGVGEINTEDLARACRIQIIKQHLINSNEE